MVLRSKIVFCLLIVSLHLTPVNLWAQKLDSRNLFTQLKDLHYNKKYKELLTLSQKHLKDFTTSNVKDSLVYAKLKYYKQVGEFNTMKDFDYIPSVEKIIALCPITESGDSLKAALYNEKAYHENEYISTIKGFQSISKSVKLLENLPNPNPGYLMGGYLLLSSIHAYFGNVKQARESMRLAEDIYEKNKIEIDQNTWELNKSVHRMGVIAKYRKIYMLYYLSNDSKDSLMLIETMNALGKMHNQPDFNKEERIYYSTALNHIGDWFVSHESDSTSSPEAVRLGMKYLLKALHYVEDKGYRGTPWAIKYNISKGFIRGNQLEKADSTMAVLFRGISPTDGRQPFFLAQKALIKVKKKEKDSAWHFFHQAIEKVHKGNEVLKKDYSNFKPNNSYNQTRLLLRIHEEVERYYKKDSTFQKMINQLPYMALQQFENSYLDVNFNARQNKELRKIIHGILKANRTGSLNKMLPQKKVLSKFEIFKNQLSWKRFYENRYTNSLPGLDSIKQRQLELASLLNKAKIAQNTSTNDSIANLINRHQRYKQEIYPQWELLSDFEFSLQTLQTQLAPNELVLKYIILDNEIAVYTISNNDLKVKTLPWKNADKAILLKFIQGSQNRNYDLKLASDLGKLLLPKIDQNITHLVINPDGVLFKLPFEVLQCNDRLLIEDYSIRYTSNLGFVHYSQKVGAPTKSTHIYAPRYLNDDTKSEVHSTLYLLQGAKSEAETISQLFPSKLFNDETLNKSQFIKTADKAKILHLAMHAEVNNDYSELSRLLFSNNLNKEEDHLYLEELYGLSLGADLAILSACNTGTGLERNGSLESFQRAFTFAGVPATVASLWEVPDASTKDIMVSFYKNLQDGQSKSEALRNAKLSYRDQHSGTKLSAPYFWAGFVVYGSDTQVVESSSNYLLYAFSACIPLFILIVYRKKKRTS